MSQDATVRVLGIGSVLMGDDGFGPWVAHLLETTLDLPEGVEVVDAGTPGLDLVPLIQGLRALVLIDTVRTEGAPGTMKFYRKEDLLRHPPGLRIGPHDPALKDTLLSLDFAERGPGEVLMVGTIPEAVVYGNELSAPVRAALGPAVDAVIEELTRLGVPPTGRRPLDTAPPPWWL